MIGVTIKYQEDTIMVNYKEILRLSAEGNSQRQIAAGSGNSRNTVIEVLESAKSHNVTWPLDGSVTNEQLEAILFPNRYASDNAYLTPDFAYIHKELAKPKVTLTLLWNEYRQKSRGSRQETLYANTVRRQVSRLGTRNEGDNAYPPQARRRHRGRLGGSDITHLRLGDR